MNNFTHTILSEADWDSIQGDINVWESLIRAICKSADVEFDTIETMELGSNAVFKIGENCIKIYAPPVANENRETDYQTEVFGLKRAEVLGILAPKIIANGTLHDKYIFDWMIISYIDGVNHVNAENYMSDDDKFEFGKKLRVICGKMNVPCEKFNALSFLDEAKTNETWSVFPESFQEERLEYLNSLSPSDFQLVYTHGDINPDNIIIDDQKIVWLIDFADAMLAPIECEYALIASQIFCFEKPYMRGFFGNFCDWDWLLHGLLMHPYGGATVEANLGDVSKVTSIAAFIEMNLKLMEKTI